MKVYLAESSIAALDSLSTIAYGEFNYFIDAIEAAVSMKDLTALLLDDINLIDEFNFTIPIRDNSIHIVASLAGEVNDQLEVTIQLQCYD